MPAPDNVSRTIRTVVCSNHSVASRGVGGYTAIDAALPFTIGWHRIDITIIYRSFDVYNIGMVIITIGNPHYRITHITIFTGLPKQLY